ncbi:MAG: NAD(P)/FAD-dependent oxidoreductase [Gemmataceae bacterium]|nr:NAD(P)/FAD-dependent oxidoreductase [Gemmataceae bacterium]MCI0743645.1 NAD(P)/FAD-dependent oxidoreductase [Gemmataceae bacterium]
MAGTYDAIIIGGGHNGLVTACYLAKAKWKVLVLERRYLVGGACVTEETFPGFKVSTAAYVNSLFRPEITRDLRLADYGFACIERNPSSFSPFPDGRYLLLGPDAQLNQREISKFSAKDAGNYPKYEQMLERVAAVIEPTLLMTPPNVISPGLTGMWRLFGLARSFQKLGPGMGEAVEILTGPARPILDRWFESEQLKATLATDAVIGAFASPSMPGTAYVLFHHVMGETNGKKGVWAYVKGGMGGLTQALARSAKDLGVDIRCEAEVAKILVEDNRVKGVALKNGDEFHAKKVASNVDPHLTFEKLLDPKVLPPEFAAAVRRINYDSASLKINVALSEAPDFTACPGTTPGPQHRGTMHICPDQDYIERAYDDAKYGKPSENPILECTLPSSVDPTVAPPGKHLMSMFIQYAPYKLKEGTWEDWKDRFADRCFDLMNEYAPNFKRSVIARQVVSPLDLERTFGLTGGNIFQGSMSLNQLFMFRPIVGWADYRTPIKGLYLCGSAAHPGGGVMGTCGMNAAREMQKRW